MVAKRSNSCTNGSPLKPGDAVVFTGDAPGVNRPDLEYQARSLGLRVTGAVSGKTSLVFAADPDSISGKARKARELGVPIADYSTYLGMLDSVSDKRPTYKRFNLSCSARRLTANR